ncbi:hypothetical protein TNCV_1494341 [Trichonephila clavipes]|nr:hypothetical protein TNCV_1494341 [Trichonephila clavipes]
MERRRTMHSPFDSPTSTQTKNFSRDEVLISEWRDVQKNSQGSPLHQTKPFMSSCTFVNEIDCDPQSRNG